MEANNNAKLREAILQIQGIICSIDHDNPLPIIYKVCEDALAAPARNCDVYTPEVLLKEFLNEMPEEVKNGTTEHERKLIELTAKGVIDALFAPYNPEKESGAQS